MMQLSAWLISMSVSEVESLDVERWRLHCAWVPTLIHHSPAG